MKDSIEESLERYTEHGTPTGGFLRAVLENNLHDAISMADDDNRADIIEICRYVYTSLPYSSHGNPERVRAWQGHKGMGGFNKIKEGGEQ